MFPLFNDLAVAFEVIPGIAEQSIVNAIFIFVGVISLLLALIFLKIVRYSFFKGMAIVFILSGAIELLAVVIPLQRYLTFQYVFLIMGFLFGLSGITLFFKFYSSPVLFWKGFGLGLIIQAIALLAFYLIRHYFFSI